MRRSFTRNRAREPIRAKHGVFHSDPVVPQRHRLDGARSTAIMARDGCNDLLPLRPAGSHDGNIRSDARVAPVTFL